MKPLQLNACVLVGLAALLCWHCAPSLSGDVYSRDQARQVQTVQDGEVILVRSVQIEGTRSGLGTVAGGILGYALGSTIGSGTGQTVARAVGTVGGGLAGAGVEEGVTRQPGVEVTVRLDNGQVIAVVQAADQQFNVGDRVRVLQRPNGEARVLQ
jgi:outer membrane lipoprotein SlyB